MIIAKDINSIYQKYFPQLQEIHEKKLNNENKNLAELNIEHVLNGKTYFMYGNKNMMPVVRYGEMMKFMQYMAKGLSPEEDDMIDNEIATAIEMGLKNPKFKASVHIGSWIQERRKRKQMLVHHELIINFLAVQLIREDEDPMTISPSIHFEKVVEFEKASIQGNSFFFINSKALKPVKDLLNLSESEFIQQFQKSKEEILNLKKVQKLFASKTAVTNGTKTSGNQ